jgi:hypothetical protein
MAIRNEVSGIPKNATSVFPQETVLDYKPQSALPVEEVTVSATRPKTSAGFDISRFKANALTNGLLRPTLYDVKITRLDRIYQFLTEAVALPTVGVDTQAIRRYGYGPVEYVPFRPVFQDSVRMNLITQATKANSLTQFLLSISEISPFMKYNDMRSEVDTLGKQSKPYEVQYKKNMEFDITVTIYDEKSNEVMTYTFKNCYAKQVGGVDLGWGNTDQYIRTSVDFAFTDFSIDSAPQMNQETLIRDAGTNITDIINLG